MDRLKFVFFFQTFLTETLTEMWNLMDLSENWMSVWFKWSGPSATRST